MAPPPGERPADAQLVRLRAGGRRPWLGVVVVAVALVVAVLKPWEGPGRAPGPNASQLPGDRPTAVETATPGPTPTPSPTPPGYGSPGGQCYPSSGWRLYAVEIKGGQDLQEWHSIEPVRAAGPGDQVIPFVVIVTDRLLGLGFCVQSGREGPVPLVGTRAWKLGPGGASLEVALEPLAEYMPRRLDLGAVYRPPATLGAERAAWPPGRYVLAVRQGPGEGPAWWFGVEIIASQPAPASP